MCSVSEMIMLLRVIDVGDALYSILLTLGNTLTLKTLPEKNGIDIYSRLHEFQERYYSAHYMTLAVQSKGEQH